MRKSLSKAKILSVADHIDIDASTKLPAVDSEQTTSKNPRDQETEFVLPRKGLAFS
jgi:hypothetical protein